MNLDYLPFEQPIADLEGKIAELKNLTEATEHGLDIGEEVRRLQKKSQELTKSIYSGLDVAQVVQLARHPKRPHTLDYINEIFTEFDELFGDRHTFKGTAIVGGIARFDGHPVMIIGHEKGRETHEKLARNFGMPQPEEYRKALRLLKLAERYELPVFTFIDTMGAYPGVRAEEHNQSEAIARNLFEMATLKTPIICTVIGEGGSGGALAIGVGDKILMLQYSIYSVISPEGCASILWKTAEKSKDAAQAMQVSAAQILNNGLIDRVLKEPLGGAHRDLPGMSVTLRKALHEELLHLQSLPIKDLLAQRKMRLLSYGT